MPSKQKKYYSSNYTVPKRIWRLRPSLFVVALPFTPALPSEHVWSPLPAFALVTLTTTASIVIAIRCTPAAILEEIKRKEQTNRVCQACDIRLSMYLVL